MIEYYLLIVKSMPHRIQAVINSRDGATKYQWCTVVFYFYDFIILSTELSDAIFFSSAGSSKTAIDYNFLSFL